MKYRSVRLILFILTFTGILLPDWVRPIASSAADYRIGAVTANVNLRKTPSLQGDIVAGLPKGSPVKVYGEKEGWYKISASKNYRQFNGWVYNRFVEIVAAEAVPTLPEIRTPEPLSSARPGKSLPAPVVSSPLPEPAARTRAPSTPAPTEKTTPEPAKTDVAKAPEQAMAAERAAEPADQKNGPLPSTEKAPPAPGTAPTDTVRLLLSISPLVLAIIALLIAARALKTARNFTPRAEQPAKPAAEDLPVDRPPITRPKPPVLERRHSPRSNRLIEVDFAVDGKFFRGFINNLSETGVYVDTPEGFSVGKEITISCPDIDTGGYAKRIGLIVRLTETGIAVHFQKTELP